MTEQEKTVDEELIPLRTSLDQLSKQIEDEGINVTRHTTEALMEVLKSLTSLEGRARQSRNTRLISSVVKEKDRARAALGLTPRKRRR